MRFAGAPSSRLMRGNILAGSREAVRQAATEYDRVLRETLAAGLMGTEESGLTVACARRGGALCHVQSASANHLATEMPCHMFHFLTAAAPSVQLIHPPPTHPRPGAAAGGGDSGGLGPGPDASEPVVVPPEGFMVAANVHNFQVRTPRLHLCRWN